MKNVLGKWGTETIISASKKDRYEYRAIASAKNKDKFVLGRISKEVSNSNIWMEFLTDLKEWKLKSKKEVIRLEEFESIRDIVDYINK